MIVVVGGIKGGSGKTTIATNLAVMRSEKHDVLLIDADDQETSSDFTVLRNEKKKDGAGYTSIRLAGSAVRTETKRLSNKYDDIIIDSGGRDTTSQRAALTIADILLVPFIPRSFDVWTLGKVSELVAEIRTINPDLKAYGFLNRSDPAGTDNQDASEIIADTEELTLLEHPIGSRKAFSNASADGLGVVEGRPKDPKAITEIIGLYEAIYTTSK